jgi:hypothetical protein
LRLHQLKTFSENLTGRALIGSPLSQRSNLERDRTIEGHLPRAINHAHAASRDFFEQFVIAEITDRGICDLRFVHPPQYACLPQSRWRSCYGGRAVCDFLGVSFVRIRRRIEGQSKQASGAASGRAVAGQLRPALRTCCYRWHIKIIRMGTTRYHLKTSKWLHAIVSRAGVSPESLEGETPALAARTAGPLRRVSRDASAHDSPQSGRLNSEKTVSHEKAQKAQRKESFAVAETLTGLVTTVTTPTILVLCLLCLFVAIDCRFQVHSRSTANR